jgi:hypothetical protein
MSEPSKTTVQAWRCPRCGELRTDSDCASCLIDLELQEAEE